MDPALEELLEEGSPDDEVAVIVRLEPSDLVPPALRVVARFGSIVTGRVRRRDIVPMRAQPSVLSVKAARVVIPGQEVPLDSGDRAPQPGPTDERRPAGVKATGAGVLIGVVDVGCDFAHPELLYPDGTTRLLGLWDQRGGRTDDSPAYGYGRLHPPAAINKALSSDDPYAALGYHPADADPFDIGAHGTSGAHGISGAHGTHCVSIAAGNGRAGGPMGIAPDAAIAFVHLSPSATRGLGNFGDSVTLLEAVDFLAKLAGNRAWVLSLSMGNQGGPHDGSTLVEQALDQLISAAPGRAACLSGGNYYHQPIHASGVLRPGATRTLTWQTDPADITPNEFECWYPGVDVFTVEVHAPDGSNPTRVELAEQKPLLVEGREVGHVYHRAHDPLNRKNHLDCFLYPGAPPGPWRISLVARDVADGRYHCWVERDGGCARCQSRLAPDDAERSSTTGTICNGHYTIAVGAFKQHAPVFQLAAFSSSGPTVDGRQKPDLVAPGEAVLAARSAPRHPSPETPLLTRKSGTSMASPHVAGCIALMFQVAPRPLWIHETRSLLLASADRAAASPEIAARMGAGRLRIRAAVEAARTLKSDPNTAREPRGQPVESGEDAMNDAEAQVATVAVLSEATPAVQEQLGQLGRVVIGGRARAVLPDPATPGHGTAGLDDAFRFALSRPFEHAVVVGNQLAPSGFEVFSWGPATSLPTPAVLQFQAATAVCALVLGGEAAYVPANPLEPSRRWVRLPRLREFYGLPTRDQDTLRGRWIERLARADIKLDRTDLGALATPTLRMLLAHFAAQAIPVMPVQRGGPARDQGAVAHGATLPVPRLPIGEPDCYLPVVAEVEGKLESVTARGLNLGVGPVQLDVRRGALLRLLWGLWEHDRELFDKEFGDPLGWSMRLHADHPDLLVGGAAAVALHGRPADAERNARYLRSGVPDGTGVDPALRIRIVEHLRNILAWPHTQELVLETSAWWLVPWLAAVHRGGIPALDPSDPDRDVFVLKALLLSAYVRSPGCLDQLLGQLRAWPTPAEKLAHWPTVLTWADAPCSGLRARLDRQQHDACRVHDAIRHLTAPAPSRPSAPETEADLPAPGNGASDVVELAEQALSLPQVASSSSAVLGRVLAETGLAEALWPPGRTDDPLAPAEVHDALVTARAGHLSGHLERFLDLVARPGEPLLEPLRSGDLLLSRPPGEPGPGHAAVIAGSDLYRHADLSAVRLTARRAGPEWYAQVVQGGTSPCRLADRAARALLDPSGRMLPGHVVVRPRPDASPPSPPAADPTTGLSGMAPPDWLDEPPEETVEDETSDPGRLLEISVEEDLTLDRPPPAGKMVGKLGIVDQDGIVEKGGELSRIEPGLNLRMLPSESGRVIKRLPHNTRLFVDHEAPNDWYFVIVDDGAHGYVAKQYVNTELPDPGARLHRIGKNEGALEIARKCYDKSLYKWGEDARFYVNVLVFVNEDAKRAGIKKLDPNDDWDKTKTFAGEKIWIPSTDFAKTLKGRVKSGSISYEAWQTLKAIAAAALEFLARVTAFVGGLVVGALESARDTITGVFDMAWPILKSLLSGQIISDAKALVKALDKLDARQLAVALGDWLEERWNNRNAFKKWYWRGWILGYVIVEVLLTIFSGGVAAAGKWAAKTTKVAKLIEKLPAVARLTKRAKALQTGKVAELRNAIRQSRVVSAVREAAEWARNVLRVPADVLDDLTAEAIEQLRKLPDWSIRQFRELTDPVKRWLLGCTSPCKVDLDRITKELPELAAESALDGKAASVLKAFARAAGDYLYGDIDELGRAVSAEGWVALKKAKRNKPAQRAVCKGAGVANCQGSHLLSTEFNGAETAKNLVPLEAQWNKSWLRVTETAIGREYKEAQKLKRRLYVKVTAKYTGNDRVPSMMSYRLLREKVDGTLETVWDDWTFPTRGRPPKLFSDVLTGKEWFSPRPAGTNGQRAR